MGKIYRKQTKLRIELNTGQNLETALERKIKYKKPDGEKGEFEGSFKASDPEIIFYEFQDGDLLQIGGWTFWSYVVFADGRSASGEPVTVMVYMEGN